MVTAGLSVLIKSRDPRDFGITRVSSVAMLFMQHIFAAKKKLLQ